MNYDSTFRDVDPMLDQGYLRQLGGYKPKFRGQHKDFYPFELKDYIGVTLYVILTWGFVLPIFYGVLEAGKKNSAQLGTVVFIGFIGFIFLMIVAMYFTNGRMKKQYLKDLTVLKLRELAALEKQEKQIQL